VLDTGDLGTGRSGGKICFPLLSMLFNTTALVLGGNHIFGHSKDRAMDTLQRENVEEEATTHLKRKYVPCFTDMQAQSWPFFNQP
jgi:hypothetical protein